MWYSFTCRVFSILLFNHFTLRNLWEWMIQRNQKKIFLKQPYFSGLSNEENNSGYAICGITTTSFVSWCSPITWEANSLLNNFCPQMLWKKKHINGLERNMPLRWAGYRKRHFQTKAGWFRCFINNSSRLEMLLLCTRIFFKNKFEKSNLSLNKTEIRHCKFIHRSTFILVWSVLTIDSNLHAWITFVFFQKKKEI